MRIGFRELLVRRGVRFLVHKAKPDEIYLCCPFCPKQGETTDTRYRLGVNVVEGMGHCFNCRWSSRYALSALLHHWRLEGVEVELEPAAVLRERKPEELPDDWQPLHACHSDLDRMARRYLIRRGITPEQIREKKIGISLIGRYAYRVIFPVTYQGKPEGFVARDFTGQQEPKYLTSLGDKSLYNLTTPGLPVILTEGVFKALRVEQVVTGWQATALLGRSITDRQVSQLKDNGVADVVVWPDPDRPGRQGAIDVAGKLRAGGFAVQVVWPVHQPADDASDEVLRMDWYQAHPFDWGMEMRILGNT